MYPEGIPAEHPGGQKDFDLKCNILKSLTRAFQILLILLHFNLNWNTSTLSSPTHCPTPFRQNKGLWIACVTSRICARIGAGGQAVAGRLENLMENETNIGVLIAAVSYTCITAFKRQAGSSDCVLEV